MDNLSVPPTSMMSRHPQSWTSHALAKPGASFETQKSQGSIPSTFDIRGLLGLRSVAPGIEAKRGLNHWVPGNAVEYISHHENPRVDNLEMIQWLKETSYFNRSPFSG